jgi:hypothetical protein
MCSLCTYTACKQLFKADAHFNQVAAAAAFRQTLPAAMLHGSMFSRTYVRTKMMWSRSCKLTVLLLGAAAFLQGVFVIMSYGWGWLTDHDRPDVWDILGSCVALAGVSICWFWPRKAAAS